MSLWKRAAWALQTRGGRDRRRTGGIGPLFRQAGIARRPHWTRGRPINAVAGSGACGRRTAAVSPLNADPTSFPETPDHEIV
jgi:hypothetical protein